MFQTIEQDGQVRVLPSDALGPIASGRVDERLFNVTSLLAQKLDTAHIDALPVIVSTPSNSARSAARKLTELRSRSKPAKVLKSIDAQAIAVNTGDATRFWNTLVKDAPAPGARGLEDDAPKVWLDGRVKASTTWDRNLEQVGAPTAWKSGLKGDGVKIAVLDTGADAHHPDLKGRITETADFSGGSSGIADAFGHGTHVAATVAGSGAGAPGRRSGVAPHADLLIGKVLGDDGTGSESSVIAGMEWAAAQGARVVNMSLGTDQVSDGSDPMSQALDKVSKESGALFVVAAGNNGASGHSTVGSPGVADSALTVGAVDGNDALAPFSSRGPRAGDGAVKPDMTAPGVAVVAARASGTSMGSPVDSLYTASSGTSMATPHVAGAAALLAQQHPEWSAARLKDALISTSHTVPGTLVADQGAGRLDLPAATGTLTATGTTSFGPYRLGESDNGGRPTTSEVTYTNDSGKAVALDLDMRLAAEDGRAAPEGSVRLDSQKVTVPAHGTARVSLAADPKAAGRGRYYGYVTASADGKPLAHTTVSLVVHAPLRTLTVHTVDVRGEEITDYPLMWGPDGLVSYFHDGDGPAIAQVEEGIYQASTSMVNSAQDGEELRTMVQPEIVVGAKDTEVVLDARRTTKVTIRTPRPAEQLSVMSNQIYRQLDGRSVVMGTQYPSIAKRMYVSPTAKVNHGSFEFASRWQLTSPLITADVPGSTLAPQPYYLPRSPFLTADARRLEVVDAGRQPFSAARLRGKLALISSEGGMERDAVEAAAKAGAAAVMLVLTPDYPYAWTRWEPPAQEQPSLALPTVRVTFQEGQALLALAKQRRTVVSFSGTEKDPYLYDVMQVSSGQIPQKVEHAVTGGNSAKVTANYADNGGSPWASEQRFGWRPYQSVAWNQHARYVRTGESRTEYVSAGDTTWRHVVHHKVSPTGMDFPLTFGMRDLPRRFAGGKNTREDWHHSVVRPAIPKGFPTPSARIGNTLAVRIPEFADSGAGHWSTVSDIDEQMGGADRETASAVLYRNGKRYATSAGAWADYLVPADAADYRLDLTTTRTSPEWTFARRTSTSWDFSSQPASDAAALPLLQLDYAVETDLFNAADAHRRVTLGVRVRHQDNLPAPQGVKLSVSYSYDGGTTWTTARTERAAENRFDATLKRPASLHGDRPVTLRVSATDAAGNRVEQSVEDAFLHRG
ncbi:S8 family serine peptidase [Streptomyces sp. NPDC098781]|uniref:S8 family serine peptidase n=1 Tax=Streptomyces sp. NPDC098781 TaxID=3366097 RepID=UPI00381A7D1A